MKDNVIIESNSFTDLDYFIGNIDKLIKEVYFYNDLYCDDSNVIAMNKISPTAFNIFQEALHNKIITSIVSYLYDSDQHGRGDKAKENLSLRNVFCSYSELIDNELSCLRNDIIEIKSQMNIEKYRNSLVSHADKRIMTRQIEEPKHGIETELVLDLLTKSRSFLIKLRFKDAKIKNRKSFPNGGQNTIRYNYADELLRKLK